MIQSTGLSFSVAFLVVLASGFLFWHVNAERITPKNQALMSNHHDVYIDGAHYHSTDTNGNLHEQLSAKSAKHFPHLNTLKLSEPQLALFTPEGESWHISATEGISTQDNDTVILSNNVRIAHVQRKGTPPVLVTTDKLIIHPKQGTADSDALVTITHPQIVLKGQGLHGDMKTGTLKLLTQIRGQYEPPTQKHQPIRAASASTNQPRTSL